MSEKRLAAVKHAFNYLDLRGNKILNIAELESQYHSEVFNLLMKKKVIN